MTSYVGYVADDDVEDGPRFEICFQRAVESLAHVFGIPQAKVKAARLYCPVFRGQG